MAPLHWRGMVLRSRPVLEASVVVAWLSCVAIFPTANSDAVWHESLTVFVTLLFLVDLVQLGLGFASYFLFVTVVWPMVTYLLFAPQGLSQPFGHSWTLLLSAQNTIVSAYVIAYLVSARMMHCLGLSTDTLDSRVFGRMHASVDRIDRISTDIFSLIALVAAYIYQPTIPGGQYLDLEYNLFAGNAWNYVCLGAYFFVIFGERSSILRRIALYGVPLWLVLHYDRGELIGLVFFGLTFLFNRPTNSMITANARRIRMLAVAISVIVVIAFTYIGYVRLFGMFWSPDILRGAVLSIINFPTVQQVNHAFAAAIEWWTRFGEYSFIGDYPLRLLPSFLVEHPRSADVFVAEEMQTNFGMPYQGEALLSMGLSGLIVAPIAVPLLIMLTLGVYKMAFGPVAHAFAFYLASLLVVRIGWYSFFYFLKVMVTVAPLVWLGYAMNRAAQRAIRCRLYAHQASSCV